MIDENQIQDDQIDQDDEVITEDLQQKYNQAVDAWKRTAADFENYKRRSEMEKKELLEFAKEVTVVKLLPTIDTLQQALKHIPEMGSELRDASGEFGKQYQNWQVGINGLAMQLDKVLEELGVKKIEAKGKKFDPHFHEAVREVEGEEDGMVVDELQSGFELNGKVIRPSQVVIGKKANSDPNAA